MNAYKRSRFTGLLCRLLNLLITCIVARSIFIRLQGNLSAPARKAPDGNASSPRSSRTKKFLAFIIRYLASIIIGASSLFLAYKSLYVNARGPDVVPAVALATWPQPANPTFRPDVSVEISASPGYRGCGTVHVHAVFTPQSGFFDRGSAWASYRNGGPSPISHFAIGITDVMPPQNIKVYLGGGAHYTFTRSGRPLLKSYGTAKAERTIHIGTLEPVYGSQINQYAIPGTIADWPVHRMPLVIDFDADWTSYRSIGSCYVQLPSLVNGYADSTASSWAATVVAIQTHRSSIDANNPAPYARSSVSVPNGLSVVDPRSTAPDNPAGYAWTCTPTLLGEGPDCAGLIIASLPNADNIRSFVTFISAALFSLALQAAYEQRRRKRAGKNS